MERLFCELIEDGLRAVSKVGGRFAGEVEARGMGFFNIRR
jgi:hypothetical protein